MILCEQRVMLAAQQIVASTKEVARMKRGLVLVLYALLVSVSMEPPLLGDRNTP